MPPLLRLRFAVPSLVGLVLVGALGRASVQDPAPAPAPPPAQQPGNPGVVAVDPLLIDVLRRHEQSQGGAERLGALRTVRFEITPALPAAEGTWNDQPVLTGTFEVAGERRVRLEDQLEGRTVVKVGTPDSMRVFVDGQPTALPDVVAGARAEATLLGEMLDLWVGAASGRVSIDNEGRRRRDDRDYHALRVARADGRGTGRIQMLFLDVETGLPGRLDVFNPATGQRHETARFSGWPEGPGPKLPGSVEFTTRDGAPIVRWRIAAAAFDPELPETHFSAP